jgi:ribonuclease HII
MADLMFALEKKLRKSGYKYVIGVDEAGRGPLAGPVVACAVSIKLPNPSVSQRGTPPLRKRRWNMIRDSKLLSEKQREELVDFIFENFYVGIGICDHKTIDKINILQATYLAMRVAVSQLKSKIKNQNAKLQRKNKKDKNTRYKILDTKYIILVDGNKTIPNLSIEQKAIVGGDKLVKSISVASIVAKVTRDRIMREYHKKYPKYNFARHKGYGTKLHRKMIKKHGLCGIHRKSFKVK